MLAVGFLGLLSTGSMAADWTVNTLTDELDTPAGVHLSLREAIRDSANGDTLRFAAELNGGTLLLTRGPLSIEKDLTIDAMSLGSGITIDGNATQRVFLISPIATIRGLTITRGKGGGVLSSGNLTMEHCLVSACTNTNPGAGIQHISGSLVLKQCSILSNRGENGSGGGGISVSGNARLVNCTVADNEALFTSGIYFTGGTADFIHCTVANNRATSSGAAVTSQGGTLRLQNSVIAGNLANVTSGSGTRLDLAAPGGTVQKIGLNFISCNDGVTTLFPVAATVGTGAAPKDALLSPMALHGGRNPCFLPLSGSKVIDAATTSADTPSFDQRNFARISGPLADLGAVEATGSVFFPTSGTSGLGLSPVLEWSHQLSASLYTVYLGTAPGSLASRGTTSTGRMALPELLAGTTYYWRIDSVVGGASVAGPIQSFATRPDFVVTKMSDEPENDLAQEGVSLREAVMLANANAGLDIIRFHPDLAGNDLQVTQGALVISSDLRIEGDLLQGGTSVTGGAFRIMAPTELRNLALGDGVGTGGFGAIHVTSNLTATNCTIAGNRATYGGGIYLQSGSCTLVHCTVTKNTANLSGGGIYRSGGILTLENCIIAGNRALEASPDIRVTASLNKRGANLIGNNSGSEGLFPGAALVGTSASPLDPVLAPLHGHAAGFSRHCAPLPGSPAIGQALALPTTPVTDQLGRPRPLDGSASVGAIERDQGLILSLPSSGETNALLSPQLFWNLPGDQYEIFFGTSPEAMTSAGVSTRGSFQLPELLENTTYHWRVDRSINGVTTVGTVSTFTTRGTILVTTLADENDPDPPGGSGVSLREAIGIAQARSGPDHVRFAHSLASGRITLTGSSLGASSECEIDAMDLPGGITLDLAGSRYLFIGAAGEVTIRGMNITGSNSSTFGSAIYNSGGVLSLSDLTMHGNTGRDGGALTNGSGRLTIERCAFIDNIANNGGALDLASGIARVTNCTFHGNRATINGGAIRCRGTCELVHCTISGNLSEQAGGLKVDSAGCVLAHCIVAGNTGTVVPDRRDISAQAASYVTQQGTNLIGINAGFEVLFPAGPLAGTPSSPLDPLLAPLADRGGITSCQLPLTGSPTIDAAVTLASSPSQDQRGLPRPQGSVPDIGAVEILPLGTVPVDVDLDGMDDRLEFLWGFVVGVNEGSADTDGDGSSNADELGNHTNPRDPGDHLRVLASSIELPPVSGGLVMMNLTWSTFPGLHYTIQRSSGLDFDDDSLRELDAGTATGFSRSMSVPLLSGRDFLKVRRD